MANENTGKLSEMVKIGTDEVFDHLDNSLDAAISVLKRIKNIGSAAAEGVLDGGTKTLDVWITEIEEFKAKVVAESRQGVSDVADAIPG